MDEVVWDEGDLSTRFLHIAQDLGRVKDPDIALESILDLGQTLLGSHSAGAVVNGGTGPLYVSALDMEGELLVEHAPLFFNFLKSVYHEPYSIHAIRDYFPAEAADTIGGNKTWIVCFPLSIHAQLLGGLFFFLDHGEVDPRALNWTGILAGQAGLVLENNRLIAATLRQASELGSVYETTSAVVDISERQQVLEIVVRNAVELTRCEGGAVNLREHAQSGLQLEAVEGDRDILTRILEQYLETEEAESERPLDVALRIEEDEQQVFALVLPMVWRKEILGYMLLYDYDGQTVNADTSAGIAHLIALQAASALGIARLIASEREERQIAEALQEASLAVNQATDLDELLDNVLEQLINTFPCNGANFMILEEDTARILRYRGYERFGVTHADMQSIELNIHKYENLSRMINGEVVVISDVASSQTWIREPNLDWLKSWAGVPIIYDGNIFGFLCLDSSIPGSLTEAVADRLKAFAAHAATAMHKADLYARLSEEHGRLGVLYEISRSVSTSLDPGEIQDQLIEASIRATNAAAGVVYERNQQGTGVNLSARSLFSRKEAPLLKKSECQALAAKVFQTQQTDAIHLQIKEDDLQFIGFPLASGLHKFGVALLQVREDFSFSEQWREVFTAAGQQAGMALDNADKHAQVQRRLAEMTILQRLISAIAGRLDAHDVLNEVTSQLYDELGYPSVQIFQIHGEELILESFSGPAPIVDRLNLQRGIIGRVARQGNPVLVANVREDEDYVSLLIGTRSLLAVPYRRDDEICGVIVVVTSSETQFDQDDLDLLMVLSDFVSVALQNAQLYEQVRGSVSLLENQVKVRTSELEDALDKAHEAERIKANFVSDISHELRTPLTNIGLYLDLLEIGGAEKSTEYMLTLRRETERLGALIEQLLAISQLDAGQSKMDMETVDLNSLAEMLVNDRARMIFKKGLVLQTELSKEPLFVKLDQRLIMQAMTNLLTNAMNYTPMGGTITIKTSIMHQDGRDWVALRIHDNGPGIDEDEQKLIFDRFFRGLAGRSSGIAGTGLGLAIAKEIVEKHSGRLKLKSRIGHGAAFTILLPLFPEDALAAIS